MNDLQKRLGMARADLLSLILEFERQQHDTLSEADQIIVRNIEASLKEVSESAQVAAIYSRLEGDESLSSFVVVVEQAAKAFKEFLIFLRQKKQTP